MERRPWQIWLAYAVSLSLAVVTLAWLTWQVLRLDEAEATAAAKAELDERVSAALWRMDVALSQLLATEAGRPVHAYQPLLMVQASAAKGMPAKTVQANISPLLTQPSDLVLLHFEADEEGCWVSPQCPKDDHLELALANGITTEDVQLSRQRLEQLSQATDPDLLLAQLDDEVIITDVGNLGDNYAFNRTGQVLIGSNPNDDPIQQAELANAQMPQQRAAPFSRSASQGGNRSRRQDPQEDFNQRFNTLQTATQQSMLNQRLAMNNTAVDMQLAAPSYSLTRSQPIWQDGRLLLVRQVNHAKRRLIQGCWLDWPAIRLHLLEQIYELIPEAELKPVDDNASISRMLASLPVQMIVPPPEVSYARLSPMRIALMVSWGCFAAAAISVGLLLNGVLRLSERRASFVSAVTHELRTPLTTFRMYSEMLAEGMVAPEKHHGYLQTLRGEADRLSHLVENVLHYSRLERSKSGWDITPHSAMDVFDGVSDRLEARAKQCGLTIDWFITPEAKDSQVMTNLPALEQILFNLVDNACKYGRPADPSKLDISMEREGDWVLIKVRDYGPGVALDVERRMFRPFCRTEEVGPAPGVGLGLALCRRLATQLRGRLEFQRPDRGAAFVVKLKA